MIRDLIRLLEQVDQMDKERLDKVFGYIAIYIILIGGFIWLTVLITR